MGRRMDKGYQLQYYFIDGTPAAGCGNEKFTSESEQEKKDCPGYMNRWCVSGLNRQDDLGCSGMGSV